jgi:hypothetical protein
VLIGKAMQLQREKREKRKKKSREKRMLPRAKVTRKNTFLPGTYHQQASPVS